MATPWGQVSITLCHRFAAGSVQVIHPSCHLSPISLQKCQVSGCQVHPPLLLADDLMEALNVSLNSLCKIMQLYIYFTWFKSILFSPLWKCLILMTSYFINHLCCPNGTLISSILVIFLIEIKCFRVSKHTPKYNISKMGLIYVAC